MRPMQMKAMQLDRVKKWVAQIETDPWKQRYKKLKKKKKCATWYKGSRSYWCQNNGCYSTQRFPLLVQCHAAQ